VEENSKRSFSSIQGLASTTTLEIEADLEQFQIVIATIHTQMFDVYVQGLIYFSSTLESRFIQVSKLICIIHSMKQLST
jgi:hypothetical protein